jgi:F0F1-type ATP synthase membrane subunit b/b'
MDENRPVVSGAPREDSFDTAVRGFNRQQVMEYMTRTHDLLTTLERQIAVARAEAQRARAGADAAAAESERLRRELEESRAAPRPVPVHTELSDRMAQILRLANEEAEQERSSASEEIARLRADTQAECERVVMQARADAEHELELARSTARQELGNARETAARELAEARQAAEAELSRARAESEITLTSAHTEADQLRLDSVRHAEHLIDDAQRRSGAVNGLASQRLDALTATHSEALSRLGQIRDVLGQLLGADAAAGSLSAAVEAAMNDQGDPDSEPVEGEIYDEALPSDVHEVIDVRDDYGVAGNGLRGGYGSLPVHAMHNGHDQLDDELDIDPRDPLGQGSGEQSAVEIDLRDGRSPGVRVVTGSVPTINGGSH